MKWLKRKVIKWVHEDWEEAKEDNSIGLISARDNNRPNTDPIINFRIYSAENGKILEFNRYDHAKDRNRVSMYIIDKEEDVSEKVSKCLSLELLK